MAGVCLVCLPFLNRQVIVLADFVAWVFYRLTSDAGAIELQIYRWYLEEATVCTIAARSKLAAAALRRGSACRKALWRRAITDAEHALNMAQLMHEANAGLCDNSRQLYECLSQREVQCVPLGDVSFVVRWKLCSYTLKPDVARVRHSAEARENRYRVLSDARENKTCSCRLCRTRCA